MGGGWGGVGGGEDSFSLVFENSIVLIKCTLYDTVFQRQVSICRGVVFSYSFSIYCAAYHGIWCSDSLKVCLNELANVLNGSPGIAKAQQRNTDMFHLGPRTADSPYFYVTET